MHGLNYVEIISFLLTRGIPVRISLRQLSTIKEDSTKERPYEVAKLRTNYGLRWFGSG